MVAAMKAIVYQLFQKSPNEGKGESRLHAAGMEQWWSWLRCASLHVPPRLLMCSRWARFGRVFI